MRGSEKGPGYWGELKKEWSACKHGVMQSPIDLSCARVKIIPRCQQLYTDYFSSNATIINRGHDLAVNISLFLFFFPLTISQSWLKHFLTLNTKHPHKTQTFVIVSWCGCRYIGRVMLAQFTSMEPNSFWNNVIGTHPLNIPSTAGSLCCFFLDQNI